VPGSGSSSLPARRRSRSSGSSPRTKSKSSRRKRRRDPTSGPPPPPGTFLGLGFDIVLGGGFTNFGSGNLAAGVRGMSDEPAERIQRMGNTLLERESGPFRSAVHASADILYNLGPRLAVGIGGDLIKARKSFKIAPVPGGPSRAFQIGAYQLYPSVTNQFPEKEKVSLFFQLYGLPRAIRDGGEVEATISQEGQGSGPLVRTRLDLPRERRRGPQRPGRMPTDPRPQRPSLEGLDKVARNQSESGGDQKENRLDPKSGSLMIRSPEPG